MGAIEKTAALIRMDVPIEALVKQGINPNKMGSREFDLLVDNIERVGITDPIMVRPLPDDEDGERYRVVGGHHRLDAAAYLGFTHVPVTVLPDDFDADQEKFQVMRMNVIRGKLDPEAFMKLYNELSPTYTDAILQEAFGFADEKEFKKLIAATAASLTDPVMKAKFKEAAKEVKTVEGLSKILNELFSTYGDSVPYGFMIFDHGGKKQVWLRTEAKTIKAMNKIGARLIEAKRTADDIVGGLLQLIAAGKLDDTLAELIAKSPEVEIPDGFGALPSVNNLQDHAAPPSGVDGGLAKEL